MKRLLPLLFLLSILGPSLYASQKKMVQVYNHRTHRYDMYAQKTIHDIQYVPPESLAVADQLQNSNPNRWTLQVSPDYILHDTIIVEGLVITPCAADSPAYAGISYTQHGWTMLLHDPGTASNEWTGAIVRVGATAGGNPDTSAARLAGFDIPSRGDVVRMVAYVDEFPATSMNSMTQVVPYFGWDSVNNQISYAVEVLSTHNAIPAPTLVTIDSFYIGTFPSGTVQYSSGEKYECGLVKFVSTPSNQLNVTTIVNSARGTFNFVDANGNSTSDYDVSHYFTLGHESGPSIPGDTSYHVPPVGAVIDTIKGAMFTSSGGENPRGYRIGPLYPGDLKLGISLPTVKTHRRYPVVVTELDIPHIQDTVRYTIGGYPIYRAVLLYSVNNGPWQSDTMTMTTLDSVYDGVIQDPDKNPFPAGTNIRYFLKGLDDHGNQKLLANASAEVGGDTSKGFFFYTVQPAGTTKLSIHDIQYTPYSNGFSPYLGATVTVGGIVTADSTDIGESPFRPQPGEIGATCWYIQSGNAPWSGIYVTRLNTDTSGQLQALRRGDSVLVTGSVSEFLNITRITDSLVSIVSHGNPIPEPVTLPTSTFGPTIGDGNAGAEPYESMLVRFVHTNMFMLHATFADSLEYSVADASGSPALIREDGMNTWSNTMADTSIGRSIFDASDHIDTLIGVVLFGNRVYKICPRKSSDLVVGDTIGYPLGWNLLSVGKQQTPSSMYAIGNLFPGMTAFAYTGSYTLASALYPGSGYWIRMTPGQQIFRQHGGAIKKDSIVLAPGWNMVGALGVPINTSSISVYPVGNHLSNFFGYAGGYIPSTTLNPKQGYWVKSDSAGAIVLNASFAVPKAEASARDKFNYVTITDAEGNSQSLYFVQDADGRIVLSDYEMPPSFPSEDFAMKFRSGRMLETYPAVFDGMKSFPIDLHAVRGPLTVKWTINNKEGKIYRLTDGANGRIFKPIELKGSGTVTGVKAGAIAPDLEVTAGATLPREFALSQNYPNPFNPTTRIQVALPQTARLEISVYNILGQKVATLVDGVRDAGYLTVEWNGTNDRGLNVGSGVYFLRMNADKFTATRKMMLMK